MAFVGLKHVTSQCTVVSHRIQYSGFEAPIFILSLKPELLSNCSTLLLLLLVDKNICTVTM